VLIGSFDLSVSSEEDEDDEDSDDFSSIKFKLSSSFLF
jgi:hypothetical protein